MLDRAVGWGAWIRLLWRGPGSRGSLRGRVPVEKHRRQKKQARRRGADTRRYFVDACHPIWGLDLVYSCWLLVGQRFLAGVGSGRKRLNILGAYCPDDQEYLDGTVRFWRGASAAPTRPIHVS